MMKFSEIPELDKKGLRQFGLTTGAIVAGLFGVVLPYLFNLAWPRWPWVLFAILAVWALLAPTTLAPVYKGWMRIGLALSRITTPIILTLVFIVAVLPMAIGLKILRKDPLHRRRDESQTYRVRSRQPVSNNLERPY